MALTDEEKKEIKKEFAKAKSKVSKIAGDIHDIVEDTIWTDYARLVVLSNDVQEAMKDVNSLKAQYDFLS